MILYISYTKRWYLGYNEQVIRIISARPAEDTEKKGYVLNVGWEKLMAKLEAENTWLSCLYYTGMGILPKVL
jgi:hypothetical protein